MINTQEIVWLGQDESQNIPEGQFFTIGGVKILVSEFFLDALFL